MVVTDGPWMDTSIFGKHNEPFGSANKPVRVFTYQVGEELREAPGLKWMACQNQGIVVTTHKKTFTAYWGEQLISQKYFLILKKKLKNIFTYNVEVFRLLGCCPK